MSNSYINGVNSLGFLFEAIFTLGLTGSNDIMQNSNFFGETLISLADITDVPILVIPQNVNYKRWQYVLSNSIENDIKKVRTIVSAIFENEDIHIKEGDFEEN
ncbi:MAG: hypothetical protein ACI9GZ_002705 [Bacteroidia bacterium]|jgi:hypothetical protein